MRSNLLRGPQQPEVGQELTITQQFAELHADKTVGEEVAALRRTVALEGGGGGQKAGAELLLHLDRHLWGDAPRDLARDVVGVIVELAQLELLHDVADAVNGYLAAFVDALVQQLLHDGIQHLLRHVDGVLGLQALDPAEEVAGASVAPAAAAVVIVRVSEQRRRGVQKGLAVATARADQHREGLVQLQLLVAVRAQVLIADLKGWSTPLDVYDVVV